MPPFSWNILLHKFSNTLIFAPLPSVGMKNGGADAAACFCVVSMVIWCVVTMVIRYVVTIVTMVIVSMVILRIVDIVTMAIVSIATTRQYHYVENNPPHGVDKTGTTLSEEPMRRGAD